MLREVLSASVLLVSTLCAATGTEIDPASFGVADNHVNWTISTGAGLVITMHQPTCDITSILFHGQQLQITSNGSYVNSGLQWNGKVTSHLDHFTHGKKSIQITCELKGLTQYFFFRANENTMYMGTWHTPELQIPELRMLALLDVDTMGGAPRESIIWDAPPIEFQDICLVGNETRSKYYSAIPFIKDDMHNVWGKAGALYAVQPEQVYETSVGGPFFRDINIDLRNYRNELTFYMNSDHTRTEQYRYGFHGPYAFAFTKGGKPTGLDYSFYPSRNLTGFVKDSERGGLAGTIADPKQVLTGWGDVVVHFFNTKAQYWTVAKRSVFQNGLKFSKSRMIPGTYQSVVYRKEMPVGNGTVTVRKGEVANTHIDVTWADTKPFWRIGKWDGTPDGFLNADKIQKMHPSDLRMAPWKPLVFEIGKNKDAEFPLAQFRGINDPITIAFSLHNSTKLPTKLRVGITVEYLSPRLVIKVNDWSAPIQQWFCQEGEVTHCAKGRSITRGVTHGNYGVYEYAIPAEVFNLAGSNNITFSIISNETDTGPWARPSVAFDAIELV